MIREQLQIILERHEEGYWWPNLHEADYDHVGVGVGAGFNVNIPLNVIGNTDTDYLHAWHQVPDGIHTSNISSFKLGCSACCL